MIDIIIKLFPNVISLSLLFLPHIIYNHIAQKNIHVTLSEYKILGFGPKTKLENEIKSNFDFIGFLGSSLNSVYAILFSLPKDEAQNIINIAAWTQVFILSLGLIWFIILVTSLIQLKNQTQPSGWHKAIIIFCVVLNVLVILL